MMLQVVNSKLGQNLTLDIIMWLLSGVPLLIVHINRESQGNDALPIMWPFNLTFFGNK